MPLVHRDILDALNTLAKSLPRFALNKQSVFEDPAHAIHELGLETNLTSAIVIEPFSIVPEAVGADTQDQGFKDIHYLYEFSMRIAFLAVSPTDRDLLALEFMPLLAGQITGTRKVLRITSIAFGKEGDGKRPIFAMSLVVSAEYHTLSSTPDTAIVP